MAGERTSSYLYLPTRGRREDVIVPIATYTWQERGRHRAYSYLYVAGERTSSYLYLPTRGRREDVIVPIPTYTWQERGRHRTYSYLHVAGERTSSYLYLPTRGRREDVIVPIATYTWQERGRHRAYSYLHVAGERTSSLREYATPENNFSKFFRNPLVVKVGSLAPSLKGARFPTLTTKTVPYCPPWRCHIAYPENLVFFFHRFFFFVPYEGRAAYSTMSMGFYNGEGVWLPRYGIFIMGGGYMARGSRFSSPLFCGFFSRDGNMGTFLSPGRSVWILGRRMVSCQWGK